MPMFVTPKAIREKRARLHSQQHRKSQLLAGILAFLALGAILTIGAGGFYLKPIIISVVLAYGAIASYKAKAV